MQRIEGSSKDILVESEPKGDEMGIAYFIPKDEFSIFDYKVRGKWPFIIPYKGIAMRYIIGKSYELAVHGGVRTCLIEPTSDGFKVNLVRVPGRELPLDPSSIEVGARNRMVDLEFIFNYYLHPRSSLLKDMREGRKDYREYGFKEMPKGGELIPASAEGRLILSYTTKYDKRGDMPLSKEEAKARSRLTDEQWDDAHNLIARCTNIINDYAKSKGILRFDGKYEVFVDSDGRVGIADTFGNPDEDRLIFEVKEHIVERFLDFYSRRWGIKVDNVIKELKGRRHMVDISKQFLRNWYIDNGWRKLYAKDPSIKPPMMHRDAISAYSDCMLSLASLWSNKVGEIVNLTGVLVRPMEEVAAELYALEYLNKYKLVPSSNE